MSGIRRYDNTIWFNEIGYGSIACRVYKWHVSKTDQASIPILDLLNGKGESGAHTLISATKYSNIAVVRLQYWRYIRSADNDYLRYRFCQSFDGLLKNGFVIAELGVQLVSAKASTKPCCEDYSACIWEHDLSS